MWPFSTLGWPEKTPELERYYKTDVLITGFDIIFFWVARMMMMGLHFTDDVPFHTVYVHALVRDENGKKMSKSLGNVIDPLDLADQYGADAVRFTLTAMAAMGRDIKLSLSRVEGYRNFGTKLWNAARFCEMNACQVGEGFDPSKLTEQVNQWIVLETAKLKVTLDNALEQYRFNDAANALYSFIWGTFCDWYLELAKPLIHEQETRETAGWALEQILTLLHPIMPFITEEIWQSRHAAKDSILMLKSWPQYTPEHFDYPNAMTDIPWIITMIENIRSARSEVNVPAGAKVEIAVSGVQQDVKHRINSYSALLNRLARLKEITYVETPPKGGVTIPLEGATVTLILAGVIDLDAERERLNKSVEKLQKEQAMLSGKLSNEAFISKAPQEIIDQQRERLATIEAEQSQLNTALNRLKELA
jgi:valyl-tRNA synthetase